MLLTARAFGVKALRFVLRFAVLKSEKAEHQPESLQPRFLSHKSLHTKPVDPRPSTQMNPTTGLGMAREPKSRLSKWEGL